MEETTELQHLDLVGHNQAHFDEQSAKWDDDTEYIRVSKETYKTLKQHIGPFLSRDHTRVLNFGCGTGLLEAQLRNDVKQIVGVDISGGMIEKVRDKIEQGRWENVNAIQVDILDEIDAAEKIHGEWASFDLILTAYTFHHLHDVQKIGNALTQYLRPGGVFCIIDFAAAEHSDQSKDLHSHLSEAASSSIGTHNGFSNEFLTDFCENQLGLADVHVGTACPLKYEENEYPTIIAYARRPLLEQKSMPALGQT